MSGGVVQLVATGPQDAWLTGKPEVSFYRSNYRRSTHYANSVERQVIQGAASAGNVSTIRFEKKGDLLSYVYLTALDQYGNVAGISDWTSVISKAELYIGGQLIDTQYSDYSENVEFMVGSQSFAQYSYSFEVNYTNFYPFKFFFCKDWSASLPLVGLQFHDVEIRITWASGVIPGGANSPVQYQAWANFVYLDQAEREWFSKNPQDMLVTQVQNIVPVNNTVQEIAVAQPVKFLAFKTPASTAGLSYMVNDPVNNPVYANYTLKTQVNGVDVGDSRPMLHWIDVPQYYNTQFGSFLSSGTTSTAPARPQAPQNVAIIPFCLDTSKLQPTGTLNFSRLDSYRIVSTKNGVNMTSIVSSPYIYAVNYNIFRIQNGLGSLLYAS